jgi:predicted ArsR family transcriptional regulator
MLNKYTTDTKRKILEHLLFEDMSTVKLSKLLGVREFAVRRHLDFMEKEGLVTFTFKQIGMGRPKKIYSLTDKARDLFIKRYSLLASLLLRKMIERSGKEYARAILEDVSNEIVKHYKHNNGNLEERIKAFADFLTEFGCYASYSKEKDGSYVLLKRNCVFWELAKQFEDIICEMDAQTTVKILNVKLIRAMCLAKGDKICKYILTPLYPE